MYDLGFNFLSLPYVFFPLTIISLFTPAWLVIVLIVMYWTSCLGFVHKFIFSLMFKCFSRRMMNTVVQQ